ncbi:WD40-repeat-containing domain protein [Entophlyctis helioformis]|nr:WD40-repeat-containing domain protein [Entophlyctis helioformis]
MSLAGHSSSVECVCLDWPEELVVAGSSSGSLKLWDLEHAKVIRTLAGHKSSATCVQFHPFGEFFASGSSDATVKLWDVRRKGCIQTYNGHRDTVGGLEITPDGRWIASTSRDNTVKIWDMTAGKLLHTISDQTDCVTSLAFSPSEFILAAASLDRRIRIYDLQSFDCLRVSAPLNDRPGRISFDSEGQALLAATESSLEVWKWDSPAVPIAAVDMKLLPDINSIISCSVEQNFVKIWALELSQKSGNSNRGSPAMRRAVPESSRDIPVESLTQRMASLPKLHDSQSDVTSQATPHQEQQHWDPQQQMQQHESSRQQQTSQPQPQWQGHHRLPSAGSSTPPNGAAAHDRTLAQLSDAQVPFAAARNSTQSPSAMHALAGDMPQAQPSPQAYQQQPPQQPSRPESRVSYIPACDGNRVLNLDLSRFIKQVPARASQPMPLAGIANAAMHATDSDIADSLLFRHTSLQTILASRLANLRLVREVWSESNPKAALDVVLGLRDNGVLVDFLRILNLKPRLLTLEMAASLLPSLCELLFEMYEDYIHIACTTAQILHMNFMPVVSETLAAANMPTHMIDLQFEDRHKRSVACLNGFQQFGSILSEMRRYSGSLGGVIRETLSELQI